MIKNIKVLGLDVETRIDRWLKRNLSLVTQSFIEKNLRKGFIKVNNYKVKSSYKVKTNDIISIYNFSNKKFSKKKIKKINKSIPQEIIKKYYKSIIFENNNFIVLNKWDGIATQGGSKINYSINDIIKSISNNYNLVHRLDIETSGLLMISKNLKTTKLLGLLFREKKIEKKYIAICQGSPKNKNSTIKKKITIHSNKQKISLTKTAYQVLFKNKKFSIILFTPFTGKKHQLRIVSKEIGCPIIGDRKYNSDFNNNIEKLKLNAFSINFLFEGDKFKFYSKLPTHFNEFLINNNINFELNQFKEI